MNEYRYSELKYNGQTYTEQWKIDEILIKNKFNWLVNAEIKNARLEIYQDTMVWNSGIWYNGDWYFGVWRDGEWRYGNWQNGVWYNGTWRNGIFKSGIIFNGKFFKGKMEGGEIRGGQFIDIDISKNVVEYTENEYQFKQEEEIKAKEEYDKQNEPQQPGEVKVHSILPNSQENNISIKPKIQQEKINYNMKNIKSFESFIRESVGDYEPSFIDINLDETELEVSDRPNLGKLKQKPGVEIIENPSKVEIYNAKVRKGGETKVCSKYPEKTLHYVDDVKK